MTRAYRWQFPILLVIAGALASLVFRSVLPSLGFSVAALMSYFLTPGTMRLARRFGAVDEPDERRAHAVPTPSWGGIAIYLGFLAALFSVLLAASLAGSGQMTIQVLGIVLGGTLIALLGGADDRFDLPAGVKLGGQIICAGLLVLFGVKIEGISDPLGNGWIALPAWLGITLTILWVVAVTNAINLIDGLDGLAAGVCAIAALSLAMIGLGWGRLEAAVLAAGLSGASFGFLPYNFSPAKVFMGDLGSHFLGYSIAAISVLGAFKVAASLAILLPLLVLAVPIFDTAFAITRRYRRRQPIFSGDRGHVHHILLARGLSQRQTVLVIYGITAAFCALAFLISQVR